MELRNQPNPDGPVGTVDRAVGDGRDVPRPPVPRRRATDLDPLPPGGLRVGRRADDPAVRLPGGERTAEDRVAAFRPPLLAIRWGTIAVGFVLAATSPDEFTVRTAIGGVILVAYATWRTLRPLTFRADTASLVRVLAEVILHVLVVVGTGYWRSPYVFSLITAIIVAGFASGFAFALRISIASCAAVALPFHFVTDLSDGDAFRLTAQWTVELVLVAVVAGFARRISGEAEERHTIALDRLGRLTEANTLLFSLHQVAQALPASLDLDEVLESTIARVRSLFDVTSAAILVPDDTTAGWFVARQEGTRLPSLMDVKALPAPIRQAAQAARTVQVTDLTGPNGPGLALRARSGLYAPLHARGLLVGVLAVEFDELDHYTDRDVELMKGFVEPVALAIDNARWFGRLRTVGADEERTRIARDLHDRVGQSLAYLAFELDRIVRRTDPGEVRTQLDHLRQDLRTVIAEVRETLYDLRTDVSEGQDLVATLEHFLERVRQRSDLEVRSSYEARERLPLPQEREMWRIAQEAVTNAERHADATVLRVTWTCEDGRAELEIADDGCGFERGRAGRIDSYGILGMRERAASIGASLDILSKPGTGTVVRCRLDESVEART